MTFLDQLHTTDAVPKRDLSPAGRFRRRLADALDQQAALAKAEAANKTYVPTKQRWVRNKTSGDKELKVIPIRVRRWWWKDETGKVFLSLKPGGRLIEIAPGERSIEISGVDDLPAKICILCQAIRAGELDTCAGSASARPVRAKKPDGKPAGKSTSVAKAQEAHRLP